MHFPNCTPYDRLTSICLMGAEKNRVGFALLQYMSSIVQYVTSARSFLIKSPSLKNFNLLEETIATQKTLKKISKIFQFEQNFNCQKIVFLKRVTLSVDCNFGRSLESELRDRLIGGVTIETLLRCLLAKQSQTVAITQEERQTKKTGTLASFQSTRSS